MVPQQMVTWKPLGELLVERRLLTVDELDDALEEQSLTGERLGAILVGRRIVASAVVTTVLAEQVGVELETQDGFGSGLFSRIAELNGNGDLELGGSATSRTTRAELTLVGVPRDARGRAGRCWSLPTSSRSSSTVFATSSPQSGSAAACSRRSSASCESRPPAKPTKAAAKAKPKPAPKAAKTPPARRARPKAAKPQGREDEGRFGCREALVARRPSRQPPPRSRPSTPGQPES